MYLISARLSVAKSNFLRLSLLFSALSDYLAHIFLTNIVSFVAVAISFLHEALVAIGALEWSLASVHAEMVMSIAQLLEGVAAGKAHEDLVWTATALVLDEHLGQAFGVGWSDV